LATLLNPYGMDYLLPLLNLLAVNPQDIVSQYIIAYSSLWPYLKDINIFFSRMSQVVWIMFLMMFFLGCLFLYELIKKKSCDLALLIVNAFLYWKGMQTARASYFFPLAFFFSFFYLLHRLKLKSIPGRAIIFSLLIFVFFFVNIFYITFIYRTDTKLFGAGLDSFVPVKEVALLKKSHFSFLTNAAKVIISEPCLFLILSIALSIRLFFSFSHCLPFDQKVTTDLKSSLHEIPRGLFRLILLDGLIPILLKQTATSLVYFLGGIGCRNGCCLVTDLKIRIFQGNMYRATFFAMFSCSHANIIGKLHQNYLCLFNISNIFRQCF
jgi:hypothetical protein